MRGHICTIALVLTGLSRPATAQRIHLVDARAQGAGDGSSWADAFTSPVAAVEAAQAGEQVWVAAGVYAPGLTRTASFRLKDGVWIFGGLAGSEDPATFDLVNRDWHEHATILSGHIGQPADSDNTFHVVLAQNVTPTAVLDGFWITGGNASGLTQSLQDRGGAILLLSASPTVRRCVIHKNQSGSRGGAIHIAGGSPSFEHCIIAENQTTVSQQSSNFGGGIYCTGTAGQPSAPTLINCLLLGNRAGVGNGGSGGAAYAADFTILRLANCTVLHNRADTLTGGIFGSSHIENSIIYGNLDVNGLTPTAQVRGQALVSFSLVQGGWAGEGNVNANPLFEDPSGLDAVAGTLDDNARLRAGSPCLDAADNLSWPPQVLAADLDGAARFVNDPQAQDSGRPPGAALADMGAYERQSPCQTSAQCDDGLHCNGIERCTAGQCSAGQWPDCSDGLACTIDSCVEETQSCRHMTSNAACDDGFFCNGVESCDPAIGCLSGLPLDCDDNVDCTADDCDEAARACAHTPNDALCDAGSFCHGAQRCDVLEGCVSPEAVDCDDGIDCTVDECSDQTQSCLHRPDHISCDDGAFCNGAETCGPGGCVAGSPPCALPAICDEILDQCLGAPAECTTDGDCTDANPCTDHACLAGVCRQSFNTAACNDGNSCTLNDRCHGGGCIGDVIPGCGADPPGGSEPPAGDPPGEIDPEPGPEEEVPLEPDKVPPAEQPETSRGDCRAFCAKPQAADREGDEDGDGVPDGTDLCPQTAANEATDASGCDLDEPEAGRGDSGHAQARRCGVCGALGLIEGLLMVCVPAMVRLPGHPRGRRFKTQTWSIPNQAACRRTEK